MVNEDDWRLQQADRLTPGTTFGGSLTVLPVQSGTTIIVPLVGRRSRNMTVRNTCTKDSRSQLITRTAETMSGSALNALKN